MAEKTTFLAELYEKSQSGMIEFQAREVNRLEDENKRLGDALKLANDTLKELKERGLI